MKKYIGLEAPTGLGMGAVGPTLALLTATLCAAFGGLLAYPGWLYPSIMLGLSAALAAFPTAKAEYSGLLKVALWPVMTAVIFASAWTSSTGMSAGEEALKDVLFSAACKAPAEPPQGAPMAPETSPLPWEDTNSVANRVTNMMFMVEEPAAYNGDVKAGRVVGGFFKRLR